MIPDFGRLKRIGEYLSNQLRGRVAILLYHRVANYKPDPQLLCVSGDNFENHLREIRKHYRPISLSYLEHCLKTQKLPRKGVVVTLDDGYVDNFSNAKPLLEQYGIPATVFVISGYVGKPEELVSDALERLVLDSPAVPAQLQLTISGRRHSWELRDNKTNFPDWDITQENYPTTRHRCYADLHKLLRPLNDDNRRQVIEELSYNIQDSSPSRPERRIMNADELLALSKDGLVDIGSHTLSHVVLAKQPLQVQQVEIAGCKAALEQILGRPVSSFAYPYGGREDVGSQALAIVRQAWFKIACGNEPGLVGNTSNSFFLSRFLVRNWDRDHFATQLRSFFRE
jgi:peptidoglycan/xylan/chitin deacetylase (PgdA/CDA1 family)